MDRLDFIKDLEKGLINGFGNRSKNKDLFVRKGKRLLKCRENGVFCSYLISPGLQESCIGEGLGNLEIGSFRMSLHRIASLLDVCDRRLQIIKRLFHED